MLIYYRHIKLWRGNMTDKALIEEWQAMAKQAADNMNLPDINIRDMVLRDGITGPSDLIVSIETMEFLERLRRGEHLDENFLAGLSDGQRFDLL